MSKQMTPGKGSTSRLRVVLASVAAALVLVLVTTGIVVSGVLSPANRAKPSHTVLTGEDSFVAGAVRAPADYREVYQLLDDLATQNGGGSFGLLESLESAEGASSNASAAVADDAAASPDAGTALAPSPNPTSGADAAGESIGEPAYTAAAPSDSQPAHSETNVQVEGIDEADIVKTDGSHIYALSANELIILKAAGASTREVSRTQLTPETSDGTQYSSVREMYLSGSVLAVITDYGRYSTFSTAKPSAPIYETRLVLYDISDPAAPALLTQFAQSGDYATSRLYDGILYLVSSYYLPGEMDRDEPGSFVPLLGQDDARASIAVEDIRIMPSVQQASYTVVASYDLAAPARVDQKSVLGRTDTSYMSYGNLYLGSSTHISEAKEPYQDSVYTVEEHTERYATQLVRIGISDGALDVAAQCVVDGTLLNQFSLDEYEGHLRLVVTVDNSSYRVLTDESHGVEVVQYDDEQVPVNALYILNPALELVGGIEGLAEDERIYSARFSGPVGYMVTYRQVDPLFALDLSSPTAPKVTSELKIPGFSTYLHPFGEGRLLGLGYDAAGDIRNSMKLSMFDTSNAFDVTELFAEGVDTSSSEALSEHRAVLVDATRNIIGFPGFAGYGSMSRYFVYGYNDADGFTLQAELPLQSADSYGYGIRGIIIDDCLYVFAGDSLDVFDLATFERLASLRLRDASAPAQVMPMVEPAFPIIVE
ncbi:MAG: beta-propeller domain-containing protein [Coriobacteriales bacterium]|jgi:uncharacterized secreted protein with C-terminal beta-propeller domain|nr:beta-propeller domain-containing protein [Coriobacteriales bacterium]